MMIGQVVAVNYKRGLVAFQIENGDCGYFEVLDTVEFEKEDKIKVLEQYLLRYLLPYNKLCPILL